VIKKPSGAEQEDRLHAAVGSVLEVGEGVAAAGLKVRRGGQYAGAYYLFGVMGFGLLFSSTPIWFKLLLLGAGYWLFRRWKQWQDQRPL
jgi:hypothetical protein